MKLLFKHRSSGGKIVLGRCNELLQSGSMVRRSAHIRFNIKSIGSKVPVQLGKAPKASVEMRNLFPYRQHGKSIRTTAKHPLELASGKI